MSRVRLSSIRLPAELGMPPVGWPEAGAWSARGGAGGAAGGGSTCCAAHKDDEPPTLKLKTLRTFGIKFYTEGTLRFKMSFFFSLKYLWLFSVYLHKDRCVTNLFHILYIKVYIFFFSVYLHNNFLYIQYKIE